MQEVNLEKKTGSFLFSFLPALSAGSLASEAEKENSRVFHDESEEDIL